MVPCKNTLQYSAVKFGVPEAIVIVTPNLRKPVVDMDFNALVAFAIVISSPICVQLDPPTVPAASNKLPYTFAVMVAVPELTPCLI